MALHRKIGVMPDGPDPVTITCKDLDTLTEHICYVEISVRSDCQTGRVTKLTVLSAELAPLADEPAVSLKDLNAIIVRI